MSATIYEVAQKAGVSTATVSRVINHTGNVSEKNKSKVLQALQDCHYTVNEMARSLAKNSTMSIALLAKDIRDDYYAHIAHAIELSLGDLGYFPFLCDIGYEISHQVECINMMLSKRVNAIVLLSSPGDDAQMISALLDASASVPVILVNGYIDAPNIYCIQRDDASATQECIQHLMTLGCRKLLFVSDFSYSSDFIKQQAFLKCGREFASEADFTIYPSSCNHLDCKDVCAFIAANPSKFDGVIASNDIIALGMLRNLWNLGIKIPQDIKLIGFDNVVFSSLCIPTLTTVDNKIDEHCKVTSNILCSLFGGQSLPQHHHIIRPQLLIRESTALTSGG